MTHCSHVLQCAVIQPLTDFHCVAEALEAWKKVENSIVSFTAVGISIDSEAASEASAACTTAHGLIVSLFPAGRCSLPCHLQPTRLCVTTYKIALFYMPLTCRSAGRFGTICESESMPSLKFEGGCMCSAEHAAERG